MSTEFLQLLPYLRLARASIPVYVWQATVARFFLDSSSMSAERGWGFRVLAGHRQPGQQVMIFSALQRKLASPEPLLAQTCTCKCPFITGFGCVPASWNLKLFTKHQQA